MPSGITSAAGNCRVHHDRYARARDQEPLGIALVELRLIRTASKQPAQLSLYVGNPRLIEIGRGMNAEQRLCLRVESKLASLQHVYSSCNGTELNLQKSKPRSFCSVA